MHTRTQRPPVFIHTRTPPHTFHARTSMRCWPSRGGAQAVPLLHHSQKSSHHREPAFSRRQSIFPRMRPHKWMSVDVPIAFLPFVAWVRARPHLPECTFVARLRHRAAIRLCNRYAISWEQIPHVTRPDPNKYHTLRGLILTNITRYAA